MPITITSRQVVLPFGPLDLGLLPELVEQHLRRVKNTVKIEEMGARLRACDFAEAPFRTFFTEVCRWGGRVGLATRALNLTSIDRARDQFRRANDCLDRPTPSPVAALRELNKIKGLGLPSFASKQLRFLHPESCTILDSLFSRYLHYPYDVDGYERITADFTELAQRLSASKHANPRKRAENQWFVADVDLALFACVRNALGHWSAVA